VSYPPGRGPWPPPGPPQGRPPQYPPQYPPPPYGPSQYGPPPDFGGAQFPRPPGKPPGPGKIIAIVLAAVVVVILVGVVALSQISVPATMATPSTYPPYSYSAPTTASRAPSSSTAPAVTSPSVTLPSVTLPPTSVSPRTSQPPSPPRPQLVNALGDNPLFGDFGLPKVQCSWPAYQADLASQRAHFTAVFACLDKAWAPVLAARNLPFTPPRVFIFDQPMTEQGCGNDLIQPDQVAFHCDGAIYIPARYFPDVEHIRPESFDVFIEMAAHEYGHYVQNLSGVLDAYHSQRQAAGENSAQGLLLSRRAELQAQCFSGMFFAAALGPQDFHDAKVDANLRGDYEGKGHRDDHGTRSGRGRGSPKAGPRTGPRATPGRCRPTGWSKPDQSSLLARSWWPLLVRQRPLGRSKDQPCS